ncbi:MAG TPA: hypothetical protein VMW56_12470 [Candidatus Margulisiibacteriota bacterium]|nr:hypothetical protein [Candidatus Margulisiibacteriota bacterium]
MFALSLATLLAILIAIGCGGPDLVIGGSVPNPTITTVTPSPTTCGQPGDACSFGTDCCSGSCDTALGSCN